MSGRHGRRVAIVGVGYSQVGRRLGLPRETLCAQASIAALDDAGLRAADLGVDGGLCAVVRSGPRRLRRRCGEDRPVKDPMRALTMSGIAPGSDAAVPSWKARGRGVGRAHHRR